MVTVGNFDGMHLGHQHVVQRAREVAQEIGVDTVVAVTFDPHPIAVLRPEHAPPTLTTIDEQLRLLGEAGVDAVLVIPFSREIAAWSPRGSSTGSWSTRCTRRRWWSARTSGSATARPAIGRRCVKPGRNGTSCSKRSSSTADHRCGRRRTSAPASRPETSREPPRRSGRSFVARGVVIEGDKRGRELGFPTANVPVAAGAAAPADGVYRMPGVLADLA